MTIRYEENKIYVAECNNCGRMLTATKKSQTEMELFVKTVGWEVWKSHVVHQPNCICYNCKDISDGPKRGGGMKKDKEWLKEAIGELNLVVTEFEADGMCYMDRAVSVTQVHDLVDQLDESEKVVIPKIVADWIEHCKGNDLDLYEAFGHSDMSVEASDLVGDMDADILARAWLYGYEVEKEKLYYIKFSENQYVQSFDGNQLQPFLTNFKVFAGQFTEGQIKKVNPNLMALAVEVEE